MLGRPEILHMIWASLVALRDHGRLDGTMNFEMIIEVVPHAVGRDGGQSTRHQGRTFRQTETASESPVDATQVEISLRASHREAQKL
jgi:hypothetical protein